MTWPLETRRWTGWCHVVAYRIWINIVTFMSIILQFNAFILLFPDLLYLSDSEIHCAAFWINQSLWDDELYSFLTLSKDVCVLHSPCLVTSVIQLWLPKFVFPCQLLRLHPLFLQFQRHLPCLTMKWKLCCQSQRCFPGWIISTSLCATKHRGTPP